MENPLNEDVFVRLVQTIRDNEELHSFFKSLSSHEALNQNLKFTGMIQSMKDNNEDPDLIRALEELRKKEVFDKLTGML